MRISDKDLELWTLENVGRNFPTRLPGMSEGEHWIFKMFYFLPIECRTKKPRIHVGHLYGGNDRFQKDLSKVVSYIQAGKMYSVECAVAYLSFKVFSPVFVFSDLEPFQHTGGNCREIKSDAVTQTRLF